MAFFIYTIVQRILDLITDEVYFSNFFDPIKTNFRGDLNTIRFVFNFHKWTLNHSNGKIIYNHMCEGFKQFLAESEPSPISRDAGHAELSRLERGHYFFVLPTNHKLATHFMKGHLIKASFMNSTSADESDIEKAIKKLTSEKDTLLVVCFPKRWEKKLGRGKNVKEIFANMFDEHGKSSQYIWGVYSHWNPRLEDHDEGHFFHNPNYHASDILLDKWLEKHPGVKEKSAVPLNRQPRVMGHHLLDQGRPSFHGWKEPELPSG